MARSGQRKPLRVGPLAIRDIALPELHHVVETFAPNASVELRREVSRELQRACRFYVAYREGEITPRRFREQIKLLRRAADILQRRVSNLLPFTRAELYINNDGRSGGLGGVERHLQLLIARLKTLQAEESLSGRDFVDPPGSLLVRELLDIFMELVGRNKPPVIRFDARGDVDDPDDVSSVEFGRFVMTVEAAVMKSVPPPAHQKSLSYRLRDKRAAITGAIDNWRQTNPT